MQKLTTSASVNVAVDDSDGSALDAAMESGIATAGAEANEKMAGLIASHTARGGVVLISDSEATAEVCALDNGIEVTVTIEIPAVSRAA